MAQAVALQSEILAKDVSSIEALWMDAHRSQERYQTSYSARLHELIEAVKSRKNPSASVATGQQPPSSKQSTRKTKDHHKDINEGLKKLQIVHGDVWRLVEENSRLLANVELLIQCPPESTPKAAQ